MIRYRVIIGGIIREIITEEGISFSDEIPLFLDYVLADSEKTARYIVENYIGARQYKLEEETGEFWFPEHQMN